MGCSGPLALAAALLLPWPSLADEAARAAPPVEFCVQAPVGGATLGHLRLVVDDTWYERHTPADDTPYLDLTEEEEALRDRKSRVFLHVLPPVLRIPYAYRRTWGESQRGPRPDRERHPDGSEYWPFTCVDIPVTADQYDALATAAAARFPDDTDRTLDHEFHYTRDNCTTWLCLLLADALASAPSDRPGEPTLVALLRKHWRPVPLLRDLQAWSTELHQ